MRAAAALLHSPRIWRWVGVAAVAVAGWITGQLDSKLQIETLRLANTELASKHRELEGRLAAVESRGKDLEAAIIALNAPITDTFSGGPLTQLRIETKYAHRNALRAIVLALAYEKDRDKARKLAKAKEFAGAFDRKISDGDRPRDAVDAVLTGSAVP